VIATRALRFQTALLASLLMLIAGCGGSTGPVKSPFAYVYGTAAGVKALRPGMEVGFLYGDMKNTSRSALTIQSVALRGPGVGSVVRLAEVKIAPLVDGPDAAPGSLYVTDPPVVWAGNACHKQVLDPVPGYRMAPGAQARIYVVFRALRPGTWAVPRQVVTYSQDGAAQQHSFPLSYRGSVQEHAPYIPPDPDEARCVKPTGSSYLPGYHAPA
jgi:hypothetical protein